jgi:hypothetical protein
MGVYAGPNISGDGLVLAFDAGNSKSLNIPTQSDHGYADWYCLVSGTVTYSIINSTGGIIYERDGSTVTTMATATEPQRGTFSVTAGRFYYGSVPINLVLEDGHQRIAPLTMAGTQFWCVATRNSPSTYYVYSPYQATTVNFYDNTAGGLTGTPTSTLSLSAGQSGTFTSNDFTNHWISSDVPIIATATQSGWDKTILSPMSTYVYQRSQENFGTTNFTTPTNNNTYVTYDSTYKVMNMFIADGAGGDCAQGLGLEYLSDTYSWGNVLSDYAMVFPYNGTFTSSYWNGSTWVVWDTHTVTTGSITNPPRITRDGTNGPGVEASTLSGLSADMASGATLWKWEGTAPFYLVINDSADDEFSVLGWNSSTQNTPRSSNIITDISGRGNNGTLLNGPIFVKDNGGSLVFDGVNDKGTFTSPITSSSPQTYEVWTNAIASSNSDGYAYILHNNNISNATGSSYLTIGIKPTQQYYAALNGAFSTMNSGVTASNSNIVQITLTWDGSTQRMYVNGDLKDFEALSTTPQNFSTITSFGDWRNATFRMIQGNIYSIKIYNKALTPQEIQQNFNATRGRFGV